MIWTLRIRSRRLSSGENFSIVAKVPVETLVMTDIFASVYDDSCVGDASKSCHGRPPQDRWRRRHLLSRLLKTSWASEDDFGRGADAEGTVNGRWRGGGRTTCAGREQGGGWRRRVRRKGHRCFSQRQNKQRYAKSKRMGWFWRWLCWYFSRFLPSCPPHPSLSDKFQAQLDVWNCSSPLMLLHCHWPNSQMPMPRCIFLTVLCVLTSLDPDFTYTVPERHAEWRNCRQCYMDVVNKVGYKCPTRCTVGKLFCTQLAVIVSGYIAITSCLSHSFFFTFLPLFALVGGGPLGMLVSYTEMRTVKTIFLSSNGVLDNFGAFCKVESPIFGFLDKKPSRKCKLVHTKVLLVLCKSAFSKFCIAPYK